MDMNNPFPTLKCFIIWSNSVQTQHEHPASPEDSHPIPDSVLYFSHPHHPSLPPEKRNRLIGLVQGIVNFTAVLGDGLQSSPSQHKNQGLDRNLRVVHSSNQKILFHQPEPGFHLCAVVKLPDTCSQSTSVTSKLPNAFNLVSQPQQPSSLYEPSEIVLLNALHRGADEYHLLHGSMANLVNDRKSLIDRLEKFWSVWLWRWSIGKTGCGAIDFDEFFGALESPFLQCPKLPRSVFDIFNRFIHQVCPKVPVLPIFIHEGHALYSPSPTERISQEDIQTLTRYLLSLLGGSEAKKSKENSPISGEETISIMKRLTTFDLNSIINLPPSFQSVPTWESTSSWAHKALTWASTSFVLPSNLSDHDSSLDNLDRQLRADMGLLTKSPSKMVTLKSAPSSAQVVTTPPSPTTLTPQRSPTTGLTPQIPRIAHTPISSNVISSGFNLLNYPENLLSIYPPLNEVSRMSHYPYNLQTLYPSLSPDDCSMGSVFPRLQTPLDRQRSKSSLSLLDPAETGILGDTTSATASVSKHNPRSPEFNVENALADAMSEHSIGSMGKVEFIPTRSSHNFSYPSGVNANGLALGPSLMPHTNFDHTFKKNSLPSKTNPTDHQLKPSSIFEAIVKQIKVYVKHGRLEAEVFWIQHESWTIALVADELNQDNHLSIREEDKRMLMHQSTLLLQALVESNWPTQPPNQVSSPAPTRKQTLTTQRFLIRNPSTGIFHKNSSAESRWLTKNEIWPGRLIDIKEIEITFGLLGLLSSPSFRLDGHAINTRSSVNEFEETYLRTNSGQWIVFKKFSHRHPQFGLYDNGNHIESFLILPPGSGTLIEADKEMRILEQQCEKLQMTIL